MNPLKQAITKSMDEYFANLDGSCASNIYELVLNQVEQPLIESVMKHTEHNQSKAAKYLGLSRNTLRKLLAKYKIK